MQTLVSRAENGQEGANAAAGALRARCTGDELIGAYFVHSSIFNAQPLLLLPGSVVSCNVGSVCTSHYIHLRVHMLLPHCRAGVQELSNAG